jgi:hypothetical protein
MPFTDCCFLPVPAILLELLPVPVVLGVHDNCDSVELED